MQTATQTTTDLAQWSVLLGDRFMAKVAVQPTGCWHWTGSLAGGRGRFWVNGMPRLAYRFSLAVKLGKDERAIDHALHACDNPMCVCPDHLREGTQAENIQECVAKGRHNSAASQARRRQAMYRQQFLAAAGQTIRAEIREAAFADLYTI